MKVIIKNSNAEIVEKKSRFIASLCFVSSEEEATKKLDEIRKKYYDAKHHCFAYIIGEKQELLKSSDDGEPSGTAGHPILDILKGSELTNVICIVTRYFGGTLLGTGGLVAAYSSACKEALKNAEIGEVKLGYQVEFTVDYDNYSKIVSEISLHNDIKNNYDKYNLPENKNLFVPKIIEIKKDFLDKVSLSLLINEESFDRFSLFIKDLTKGKVVLEKKNGRKYVWKNFSPYYIW